VKNICFYRENKASISNWLKRGPAKNESPEKTNKGEGPTSSKKIKKEGGN